MVQRLDFAALGGGYSLIETAETSDGKASEYLAKPSGLDHNPPEIGFQGLRMSEAVAVTLAAG
jgi:hypothetical protein